MPEIIYEDEAVLVISKPAGFATQSANVGQKDCVSFVKEHLSHEGSRGKGEPYVGIVHRLDQPVAGLLVFAKTKEAAASLSKQVQNGMMNKHYVALVEGIIDEPDGRQLCNYIGKDPKTKNAFIADGADGNIQVREAKLIYRTDKILRDKNESVLSIDLITGRFHQIRAQLSHMGHPIVGDRRYGAASSYPQGIALAADRLVFMHPLSGEKVEKIVDFSFFL